MPGCLLQFQGQKFPCSPGTFHPVPQPEFSLLSRDAPNSAFDLSCHLSRLIEGKEVETYNVILEDLKPQPV